MRIIASVLVSLVSVCLWADICFIGFTDKHGTTGSLDHPEEYLSAKALARRQSQNIVTDSLDLPVSELYIDSLRRMGYKVRYTTKWLNGVVAEAPAGGNILDMMSISFIRTMQYTRRNDILPPPYSKRMTVNKTDIGLITTSADRYAAQYTTMLRLDSLFRLGFYGQGKTIAVVDNGFLNVNTADAFTHTRPHILGTYDIVELSDNVYSTGFHGAAVLSLISGARGDTLLGTAPESDFYLFHTEDDDSESMLEVDNMVRAFELADSLGADIITASLGYYVFNDESTSFTYADMNGKTARCSLAATVAANKGILVFIAAGNEGNKEWHYIDAPADAEDILTVGGVDINREHSTFSSYGPTADGRVKPDICAMATNVPYYYPDAFYASSGTSFATPIMAGAAATLWSAMPQLTAREIRQKLIHSADRYLTPDSAYGYGIPDLVAAYYDTPSAIEYAMPAEAETIAIYDISGHYMGTQSAILPRGIYIVKRGNNTTKIVK